MHDFNFISCVETKEMLTAIEHLYVQLPTAVKIIE